MTSRRSNSSYRPSRRKRRRISKETRTSFVFSSAIHAVLIVLIGIAGGKKLGEDVKLTEISYIEERYGMEVAKKVTVAPEKLPVLRKEEPVKREGSLFAKAKPEQKPPPGPIMNADMASVPLPKPIARETNPFEAKRLESRRRSASASIAPKVEPDQVLLSAGLSQPPREMRIASEEVALNGKVLVGRKSRLPETVEFQVDEGDVSLAGSAMTLALPSGGVAEGHPELVGGELLAGREAYRGDLPAGHLVAKSGRDRLLALAEIDVGSSAPGVAGSELGTAALLEPTAGKGLVSRGGSDAISRGVLRPGPALRQQEEPLARTMKPPSPSRAEEAPAEARRVEDEDGVSMTLSGPILDRAILVSRSPSYPEKATQRGWQGTVSIYFTVRPDGTINKILTEKASTHQVLDEAAGRCLRDWRFSPVEGAADQWGVLTIVFRLR